MNAFGLKILTAERVFFDGNCTSLVVPSIDGQYGIQAHHENVILAIVPGTLHFFTRREGTDEPEMIEAAVSEGILKAEGGEVLLLVDTAERPEEIDLRRAERAAAQAQEELLQKRSVQDNRMAQERLMRSLSRIKTKNHRN